jgi:hypothetical protein
MLCEGGVRFSLADRSRAARSPHHEPAPAGHTAAPPASHTSFPRLRRICSDWLLDGSTRPANTQVPTLRSGLTGVAP